MEKNLVWDFSPPKFLKRSYLVRKNEAFSFLTADMFCILYLKKGQATVTVNEKSWDCKEHDSLLFCQRQGIEVVALSQQTELNIVFLTQELCEEVKTEVLGKDYAVNTHKCLKKTNTWHFLGHRDSSLQILFKDLFADCELRHKRTPEEIVFAIAVVVVQTLTQSSHLQAADGKKMLHATDYTQDMAE